MSDMASDSSLSREVLIVAAKDLLTKNKNSLGSDSYNRASDSTKLILQLQRAILSDYLSLVSGIPDLSPIEWEIIHSALVFRINEGGGCITCEAICSKLEALGIGS